MSVDPIERHADDSENLYEIATWAPQSVLDRTLSAYGTHLTYGWVLLFVVLLFFAFLLQVLQFFIANPASILGLLLFPLSVIPALVISGYIWHTNMTRMTLKLVVVTFLLEGLLMGLPLALNSASPLGDLAAIPVLGFFVQAAEFYLVVGPVEEVTKLLAVYLYAFRNDDFNSVIDGAFYGAIAGLSFATFENMLYIVRTIAQGQSVAQLLLLSGTITVTRSLAGPGHVLWSAIAGYYLGLAKFNPEYRKPLILKGLVIAAFVHATYNTFAATLPGRVLGLFLPVIVTKVIVWGIIAAFHLVVFGYVFWMLRKYRKAYERTGAEQLPREDSGSGGLSGLLDGVPGLGGSEDHDGSPDGATVGSGAGGGADAPAGGVHTDARTGGGPATEAASTSTAAGSGRGSAGDPDAATGGPVDETGRERGDGSRGDPGPADPGPADGADRERDPSDGPSADGDLDLRVAATVDAAARSWSDDRDRLAARKRAAMAVLEHAVVSGDAVGRREALEFYDEHRVPGQTETAWYRENVLPVLRSVGTYARDADSFRVRREDLLTPDDVY